jgi:ribosomal protein S27E
MVERATTRHRCHNCGATSYKSVIGRDEQGAMRPTGRYRCTGCDVVFSSAQTWREGAGQERQPQQPALIDQRAAALSR